MGQPQRCAVVNRRLLPVKIHYFLFMAALACALPFRTIFAKQLGISATAVGVIFCAVPFLKTVTNPLFGFILDYFKRFRLTLAVMMIVMAASHVAMISIPPRTTITQNDIHIPEENLRTKITHFCSNKTSKNDCKDSLIVHSEYTLIDESIKSFTCDVHCLDAVAAQRKDNIPMCKKEFGFDFKVFINIFSCNMSVSFKNGKLFLANGDNHQNTLLMNVNENSAIQLESWRIPVKNCLDDVPMYSDSLLSDSSEKMETNISDRANLLKTYISALHNARRLASKLDIENSIKTIEEYNAINIIKTFPDITYIDKQCSFEFMCQTSKCYYSTEIKDRALVENEFLSAQFWAFFFLMAVSGVTLSAICFSMDAVCYEMLQENRDRYGQQRLWGTIGWGVGALVGGYLNQIVSSDASEIDYAPSFYLLAILSFVDLIPVYQLKVDELKYSSHIWKDVCFLFSKIDIAYNVLIVYSIGALSGFIWNYQFWFMEEIGSNHVLLGLSQTFECIFELPWFLISGYVIKKIGHSHCNNITFLCFGLRYLCFVVMYDPWWTLAAGLFHGPTFGLFYASMTMYAKNEAPPGTEATVQSLFLLSFEGLGVATGSFLGGVGLDRFGGRTSFMYAATLSFLLLIVNLFMGILFSRTKRSSKEMTTTISCP